MKEQFTVAENVFSITAPDGFAPWESIKERYMPFASADSDKETLHIDIGCGPVPVCAGERIYEPMPSDVGITSARASRLPGGEIVIELTHLAEDAVRVWMRMTPGLDRAEIVIPPGGDHNDSHFLTHALMIAFMLGTVASGTLMIHASAVTYRGQAYLFQGRSGTGKSTHSKLWLRHIESSELLNDDNPLIRFTAEGAAEVYGSPWSGKTPCYRNLHAPIGGVARIVRGAENELLPLSPLRAYASLTASVFYMPFLSEQLRAIRHRTIERLAAGIPCYEMRCRPDREAAIVCHAGIIAQK